MEEEKIPMTLNRIKREVRKLLPESWHDIDNLVVDIWLKTYEKGFPPTRQYIRWKVWDYIDFINHRLIPGTSLYAKKDGKEYLRPEVEEKLSINDYFIKDIEFADYVETLSNFLTPSQKRVFKLKAKGLEWKEIAKILNITESAVFQLWRKIRRLLSWILTYNKKFAA